MAKNTFVGAAVPRCPRGNVLGDNFDTTGNHARWIGDEVMSVLLTDKTIDFTPANSGCTGTGLQVKNERRPRNK